MHIKSVAEEGRVPHATLTRAFLLRPTERIIAHINSLGSHDELMGSIGGYIFGRWPFAFSHLCDLNARDSTPGGFNLFYLLAGIVHSCNIALAVSFERVFLPDVDDAAAGGLHFGLETLLKVVLKVFILQGFDFLGGAA